MNRRSLFVLFCFTSFLNISLLAQLPTELHVQNYAYLEPMHVTTVTLTQAQASQGDMISDGKGHHYVAPNSNGSITHYLFDNVGTLLSSTSFGTTSSAKPAITARNGVLHVVLHNSSSNTIEFWQSSNAGAAWSNPDFRTVQGTLDGLDAFEDFRGVHVTYSSTGTTDGGIYYHMRNVATNDWAIYASAVHSGSAVNAQPTITTSTTAEGDSAHILSLYGLSSFKFPSSGTGQWVPTTAPYGSPNSAAFVVCPSANTAQAVHPYMFVVCQPGGASDFRRGYRQYDTQVPWTTFLQGISLGTATGRASVAITPAYNGDWVWPNFVYADYVPNGQSRVYMYRQLPIPGVSPPSFGIVGVTQDPQNGDSPVTSANQGSLAIVWRDLSDNRLRFRRKPYPIEGTITEDHALTGTNWILENAAVTDGAELRLKSGSVTYVVGSWNPGGTNDPYRAGHLTVSSGGSLIVEDGAQLILQPVTGTQYQLTGGILELGANATLTVSNGGYLQAGAEAQFIFGQNAGLVINGGFVVLGNADEHVTFTSSNPGNSSWNGITVDNAGSIYTTQINYADISYCTIGVSTRSDALFSMSNCIVDQASTGLEIVPGESEAPSTPQSMIISNNTFSNIGATGISVDGLSTLVLQGNTITQPPPSPVGAPTYGILLTNASPQMLNNTINGFYNGLYCVNASSPVLENLLLGGYNVITECAVGVECDNSDPVLGFIHGGPVNDEGGQNSIFQNSVLDVSLWGKSFVLGENNWYGADRDPPGVFYVDDGAYLDYDPWLRENPNLDGPGANGGGERQSGVDLLLLKQILAERTTGNDREAIRLLRSLIANEEQDSSMKEWAIRQIVAIAQTRNQTGLSEYLRNLLTTSSGLARQIKAVLPAIYATERSTSNMLAAYSANIQEYPNTHLERSGLYGTLVHAIYTAKDYDRALQLFTQLETGYPRSAEVVVGRVQLENFQSRLLAAAVANRSNGGLMKPGEEASQGVTAPTAYRLSDSYPNPFNPSTTLSFDLPEPASVSLVVYDVLGRKIAELAEGSYGAGTHTATWNAEQQASGVYFARFVVTGTSGEVRYSKVNKLVLMK